MGMGLKLEKQYALSQHDSNCNFALSGVITHSATESANLQELLVILQKNT